MTKLTMWVSVAALALAGCGGSGGSGDDDGGGTIDGGGAEGGPIVDAAADGTVIAPGPTLVALSAGAAGNCAILDDSTVRCWGDGRAGQLGNSGMTSSVKPVPVMGITTAKSISVGYEHSCVALADGTARCWGKGTSGQLGNNMKVDSPVPVVVQGLTDVATVHAGVYTSCALTNAGTVFCWGRGGDLGDGLVGESLIPKQVPGLSMVKQFSLSANAGRSSTIQACGVRMNGTAFCWGGNDAGQLGDNSQNQSRVPVEVMGVTDAIEIKAGGGHTCARRTSGLFCWGFSALVGDGTVMQRLVPTPVMTTAMVDALATGDLWTLARTTAGGLICWGQNGRGQCGDGAAFTPGGPNYQAPITSIPTNVALFAAGSSHSCAYTTARITYCWGSNEYGEAGSGMPSSLFRTSTPMPVIW